MIVLFPQSFYTIGLVDPLSWQGNTFDVTLQQLPLLSMAAGNRGEDSTSVVVQLACITHTLLFPNEGTCTNPRCTNTLQLPGQAPYIYTTPG